MLQEYPGEESIIQDSLTQEEFNYSDQVKTTLLNHSFSASVLFLIKEPNDGVRRAVLNKKKQFAKSSVLISESVLLCRMWLSLFNLFDMLQLKVNKNAYRLTSLSMAGSITQEQHQQQHTGSLPGKIGLTGLNTFADP